MDEIEALFQTLDSDRSGSIEYHELLEVWGLWNLGNTNSMDDSNH